MKLLLIKVLVLINLVATTAFAEREDTSSGREGGGGDSAEIEFKSIGQQIAKRLEGNLAETFKNVNAELFKSAVESSKVIMTSETLFIDNQERKALNYPRARKIEVFRPKWTELSPNRKVVLAFHEYLGIAGIADENYQISSLLPASLGERGLVEF